MNYKIYLLSLFILFTTAFVAADVEVTYNFYDENEDYLDNVNYLIYNCENEDCSQVGMPWYADGTPISDLPWNSNENEPNHQLIVQYPTQLQTSYGYAVYYLKDNHIPMEGFANWHGEGFAEYNINFNQEPNCQALIQNFDITNEVYPNMPIMVNINAIVDWDTYSAFEPNSNTPEFIPVRYDPSNPDVQIFPEFYDLYAAQTDFTLTIYDENDNIVFERTNHENIFMGESINTVFTWIPEETGQYYAIVEADVVDNQCSSSISTFADDSFTVIPEEPTEMCYTLLHDFEISEIYPEVGDTIELTATKISNHLDDETGILTPVETDVDLTIYDQNENIVFQELQHLPANPNEEVWADLSFTWEANQEGIFSFVLHGIANDPLCEGLPNLDETKTIGDITIEDEEENSAPIVEILTPQDEETISDNYLITWNAYDLEDNNQELDIKIAYQKTNLDSLDDLFEKIINLITGRRGWETIFDSNNNPGEFLWDTTQIDNGNYELKITVKDSEELSNFDVISFTLYNEIISENQNPVITSTPITKAKLNELYKYDVNARDPNGDELRYFLIEKPTGMEINDETGLITWTPTKVAEYEVEVKVDDLNDGFDTQKFTIKVTEEEIVIDEVRDIHKFTIQEIRQIRNGNDLDLYVYIRNKGNVEEDNVELKAVVMQTGLTAINYFDLETNNLEWHKLTLNSMPRGIYAIQIIAKSDDHTEMRYVTSKIG